MCGGPSSAEDQFGLSGPVGGPARTPLYWNKFYSNVLTFLLRVSPSLADWKKQSLLFIRLPQQSLPLFQKEGICYSLRRLLPTSPTPTRLSPKIQKKTNALCSIAKRPLKGPSRGTQALVRCDFTARIGHIGRMSSLKCTHTRRKSLFCLACAFGTLLAFLIRSQADAAPARLSLGFGALPWGCG